jgi:hypothetical protein
MKEIIGGIVGALVAGVAILGWSGRPSADEAAWQASAEERPAVQLASSRAAEEAFVREEPTVDLTCEPGQRAVLRRSGSHESAPVQAACISDVATFAPSRLAEPAMLAPARVTPAVYTPASVTPARTIYREPASRRVENRRSWKKTALVIGGSAGAGAGVGALAGGKKGALIGAAIGGGAATLYEAVKR